MHFCKYINKCLLCLDYGYYDSEWDFKLVIIISLSISASCAYMKVQVHNWFGGYLVVYFGSSRD